jgi:DNA-binding GntR family transcriptional regulator
MQCIQNKRRVPPIPSQVSLAVSMGSNEPADDTHRRLGSETSSDVAYQLLRRAIVTGRYRPGDRLTELALTAELGMSRTPVREAIMRLHADGLVVSARKGALVRRLSVVEVSHLYHVRATLEALTAELAARNQQDGGLSLRAVRELGEHEALFERAVRERNVGRMVRANLGLHQYIAELAGNPFAGDALRRVWDIIALSSITNLQDHVWARQVVGQHRMLIQAIRSGDPRRAAAVARRHVLRAAAIYTAPGPAGGEVTTPAGAIALASE